MGQRRIFTYLQNLKAIPPLCPSLSPDPACRQPPPIWPELTRSSDTDLAFDPSCPNRALEARREMVGPDHDPDAHPHPPPPEFERNPRKIYVFIPQPNHFERSSQVMAGYLGLPDTKTLFQFTEAPDIAPIILQWVDTRKSCYHLTGLRGKDHPQLNIDLATMFNLMLRIELMPFFYRTEPITQKCGLPIKHIAVVTWINAMHRILLARPDFWPVTRDTIFSTENYHRVYRLLKWVWAQHGYKTHCHLTGSHEADDPSHAVG